MSVPDGTVWWTDLADRTSTWMDDGSKQPPIRLPAGLSLERIRAALSQHVVTLADRIDQLYDALDDGVPKWQALRACGFAHTNTSKVGLAAYEAWLEEQDTVEGT